MTDRKFVFIGGNSSQSHFILEGLITQNLIPAAVIFPRPESVPSSNQQILAWQPMESRNNVLQLLRRHEVRIDYLDKNPGYQDLQGLQSVRPDWMLIACYPHLLPHSIYSTPRYACLNVHPSTLPTWRGPAPVFWQLREGNDSIGVSLHVVNETFDTGGVVSQSEVSLEDFPLRAKLERRIANASVKMFAKLVTNPKVVQNAKAQSEKHASYAAMPQAKEYIVPTTWTDAHACRFIRGIWPAPYPIYTEDSDEFLEVREPPEPLVDSP